MSVIPENKGSIVAGNLGMSVSQSLLRGLEDFFREERFIDVTVDVQGQPFHCHRIVLSAVSRFFDAMFSSGMKESKSERVTLKDVDASIFRDILSYVYKGTAIINETNAEELYKTSSMLQIPCLQEKCENFISMNVDRENCLGIWKLSKATYSKSMESLCWSFISNNFESVCQNDEFLKLEPDDVSAIIKDDELNVANEETVFAALIRWVEADKESRRNSFPELFEHVRLSNTSLDYILDEIDSQPLVHFDQRCSQRVKDVIKFHAMPFRRQELSFCQEKCRTNSFHENVLVVAGRRLRDDGTSTLEFISYSFSQDKWFSLNSIPSDLGEEFAACVYGNDIFLTGGTKQLNTSLRFSSRLFKWKRHSSLTTGRYRHSMVATRDYLYVLGGYNFGTLKNIESYDIDNDVWRSVGELLYAVDASSAVACGSKIFVFGGWLRFAEDTAVIQCFDIRTKTCSEVCKLPTPTKFTRALPNNNRVDIICSGGEVVSFTHNCTKLVSVIPNFSRKNFGIFKDNNKIYILGGEDISSGDKLSDRNVYCVEGKEVSVFDAMRLPVDMEIDGCFKIVIDKSSFDMDYEKMLRDFDVS